MSSDPTTTIEGLSALAAAAKHLRHGAETPALDRSSDPIDQSAESDEVRQVLREMSETFSRQMAAMSGQLSTLSERLDNVERPGRQRSVQDTILDSAISTESERISHLWCDRPLDEPLPREPLSWPDEDDAADDGTDDADGCQLHRVTPATENVLRDAFSKTVPNATRRRWRRTYGMPASDHTKCPKLDATLRPQVPKEGKDADRALSRLQTFVLDAIGPLASLLEQKQAGRLTAESAADAATQALRFLDNAHAHISTERRKRIITHFNADLRPLVEDADRFQSAAPLLFGKDFEKSAKEHVDSVRSLKKLGTAHGGHRQPQFFRSGRPHTYSQAARGGGAFRGGSRPAGRGRFRPYQTAKENRPRNAGAQPRQ